MMNKLGNNNTGQPMDNNLDNMMSNMMSNMMNNMDPDLEKSSKNNLMKIPKYKYG